MTKSSTSLIVLFSLETPALLEIKVFYVYV
jgi:hypothetical protein